MRNITFIILTLLLSIVLKGNAQEFFVSGTDNSDTLSIRNDASMVRHRWVASQLSVGGTNYLDTYLSPEKYRGTELRFVSQVVNDSRKRSMTYLLTHEGALGSLHNRVGNANEYIGHYDFSYAMMYRWETLGNDMRIMAGGMADAYMGFCYNSRNSSNNPAQGYLSAAIGPQLMVQYRFSVLGKMFCVGYEMRMPFIGVMFSPNYGQSYYEMFNRGNYDHNVVVTTLATFQMRQQLSLVVPVAKRTAISIGYLSDIRQATPNNLKQHYYYNAATIGVIIKK